MRRLRLRRPDTELSAETRARLAHVIAAHDNPAVTVADFRPIARAFAGYLSAQPEAERFEAAMCLHEHVTRATTGHDGLMAIGVVYGDGGGR